MNNEFVIGGVYLSPIVSGCIVALLLTIAISAILTRLGFYRLVWHRPLVEVAIFCMLLAAASWLPLVGIAT